MGRQTIERNIACLKQQRAAAFYRRDQKMVDDLDGRIAGLTERLEKANA